MSRLLSFAAVGALTIAAPSAALAQAGWNTPGYNEGYQRGQSAGAEDSRRGNAFEFTDEGDYRRGDSGYRSQYGSVTAIRKATVSGTATMAAATGHQDAEVSRRGPTVAMTVTTRTGTTPTTRPIRPV